MLTLLFVVIRQEVIERLQSEHSVVILVTNSLTNYMDKVRQLVKENPEIDANTFMPDGRYNHIMQVQERLNFLRFLLKVRVTASRRIRVCVKCTWIMHEPLFFAGWTIMAMCGSGRTNLAMFSRAGSICFGSRGVLQVVLQAYGGRTRSRPVNK